MLSVPWQIGNSHPGERPRLPRSAQIHGLNEGWGPQTLMQAVGRPATWCAHRAPQCLLSQVTVAT